MIEHEQIPKEKKVGFTSGQREFVKRAYQEVLGFAGCVFPVWEEGEGEYRYCKSLVKINIHHIKPRGYCIKVLKINPNVAPNGIPICVFHHIIGNQSLPMTREFQEVLHLDSAYAKKNYNGKIRPTTFDRVNEQRRKLSDVGRKYWWDLWDQYLSELAEDVMGEYLKHNDWPKKQ